MDAPATSRSLPLDLERLDLSLHDGKVYSHAEFLLLFVAASVPEAVSGGVVTPLFFVF